MELRVVIMVTIEELTDDVRTEPQRDLASQ